MNHVLVIFIPSMLLCIVSKTLIRPKKFCDKSVTKPILIDSPQGIFLSNLLSWVQGHGSLLSSSLLSWAYIFKGIFFYSDHLTVGCFNASSMVRRYHCSVERSSLLI